MSATEPQTGTSKLPAALASLGTRDQFIVWESRPDPKGRKPQKIPLDKARLKADDSSNRTNWYSAGQAFAIVDLCNQTGTLIMGGPRYGVGFVLTEKDPFFCLDIDNCLQANGTCSQLALDLCKQLPGAAVEVSHSGRGLHIWGMADPMPPHGCRNTKLGIELYTDKRFIALGRSEDATGDTGTDCTAALSVLMANYFPPGRTHDASGAARATVSAKWTTAPVDEYTGGGLTDAEIIDKARKSKSGSATFDGKVSFEDLWTANTDALSDRWPHETNDYDKSSADIALAVHLAFWTGKDCERIRRLMWQSDLAREKWDREDYLPRTIKNAVKAQTEVYTGQHKGATKIAAPVGAETAAPAVNAEGEPQPNLVDPANGVAAVDIANWFEWVYTEDCCYSISHQDFYLREPGKLWTCDKEALRMQNIIRDKLRAAMPRARKVSTIMGNVVKTVKPILTYADTWDTDPETLGLPDDRVLDLSTGQIRAARKEDRITRRAGCLPREGDPTLILESLKAVIDLDDWPYFLPWFQTWCGYLLTGYRREHKFMFIHGPERAFKSTLINILAAVMGMAGGYAVTLPRDALIGYKQQHDQWKLPLEWARLAFFSETGYSDNKPWRDDLLKEIASDDPISADPKHKDSRCFEPVSKLMVTGNQKPAFRSVTDGIARRLILVEFNQVPESAEDKNLAHKVKAEHGKFFGWMVEGARTYLANGMPSTPPGVERATHNYITHENRVATFLEECFVYGPDFSVDKNSVFNRYNMWSTFRGETAQSRTWLFQQMAKPPINRQGGRGSTGKFQGMALNPENV